MCGELGGWTVAFRLDRAVELGAWRDGKLGT